MDKPAAASQRSQSRTRTPRDTNDSERVELSDVQSMRAAVFKGPKRKRLVKACNPCHKSKRRCDGTAPCSNCYYASKDCTYTDSTGKPVPAPNALRPDIILGQPNATAHSPTSINISAPDAASGSYPPPESLHSRSGVQHSEASLSVSTAVPGPSFFVANRSFETSAHDLLDDISQTRGSLRPDLPRDHPPPRKRLKNDPDTSDRQDAFSPQLPDPPSTGGSVSFGLVSVEGAIYKRADGTVTSGDFHKHVVRELVNLFFAHCHPHRLIIHSASFHTDLCRNRVPPYLLNAICAVSAPLSQNPLVRMTPIRESGQRFADAALAALFDAEGQLMVTGVEVAQALVLVQTYKMYKEGSMQGDLGLYDLALRILHSRRVLETGSLAADAASPSPDELYARAIQRESARRTFWLIHMVELLGAVFTQRPTMYNKDDLAGVRLPCDEASFDLALELPPDRAEYLDSPALKTSDTSEFGHVIRIATVLLDIERNNLNSPDPQAVLNCEQQLEQWVISLSDHLKYSPENLQVQLSLWETGSNTSTWCYCFMHILHACSVLALSSVRRRLGQTPCRDHESALTAFPVIINALGPRARNSILMGSVLWLQYCGPHAANYNSSSAEPIDSSLDTSGASAQLREEGIPASVLVPDQLPQLDLWIKEWEEFWGPATMHGNGNTAEVHFEERSQAYQQTRSTAASVTAFSMSVAEAQVPSNAASTWNVPDVVIDPVLRSDEKHNPSSAPQASPALSTTSTLRGRDQPSLPSLKSSGLLDVFPDEPLGSRSSGASTPVKPPPHWQLSSPRPPLLSPGLPIPGGSSSSGSTPVSPQPHSPNFQASHTPQARLQAPGFYQSNSPQPSLGIVAPSSPYQETETHASRTIFGPHRVT